jgi:hypothetical protein
VVLTSANTSVAACNATMGSLQQLRLDLAARIGCFQL